MRRLDPKVWGPALGAVIALALFAAFWFSNPGPDGGPPPPIKAGGGPTASSSPASAASSSAPGASPVLGMKLQAPPPSGMGGLPTGGRGSDGPSPSRPPGPALEMPSVPGR